MSGCDLSVCRSQSSTGNRGNHSPNNQINTPENQNHANSSQIENRSGQRSHGISEPGNHGGNEFWHVWPGGVLPLCRHGGQPIRRLSGHGASRRRSATRRRLRPRHSSGICSPFGDRTAPVEIKTMQIKLTDGRTLEVETNAFGQVYCGDIPGCEEDFSAAAELMGANPSEIRYGFVHPGPAVTPGGVK